MCRWTLQDRWAPPEHPRDTSHTFSASYCRLPIRPVSTCTWENWPIFEIRGFHETRVELGVDGPHKTAGYPRTPTQLSYQTRQSSNNHRRMWYCLKEHGCGRSGCSRSQSSIASAGPCSRLIMRMAGTTSGLEMWCRLSCRMFSFDEPQELF